jgi:hypothetical protein
MLRRAASLLTVFSLSASPAQAQFEPLFELFGIDPHGQTAPPEYPPPYDPRGGQRMPPYQPPARPYQQPSEEAPYRGETVYITVPTGPPPRGAVPIVKSAGPHVGRWSIWRGAEPESGNETFKDGQTCVDEMAKLSVKFQTQVNLTCENAKETVVAYEMCKPAADGFPFCASLMRSAPRPRR